MGGWFRILFQPPYSLPTLILFRSLRPLYTILTMLAFNLQLLRYQLLSERRIRRLFDHRNGQHRRRRGDHFRNPRNGPGRTSLAPDYRGARNGYISVYSCRRWRQRLLVELGRSASSGGVRLRVSQIFRFQDSRFDADSLRSYIFFFGISWGPGAWVVTAEIYPISIRAKVRVDFCEACFLLA